MSTILVVDDNIVNRRLIVGLLARHKHLLQEANDGVEALEKVNEAPPDLIFTDILMPKMDGYELIRKLRANSSTAQIPIIVYTSLYLASAANKLTQSYGVSDILTRPSKPELIIKAVNTALGIPFLEADPQKASGQRLESLIEVTQQLISERDPHHLLEGFCNHLRKTIGAKCAFIGILDESQQRLQHFITSGIEVDLVRDHLLPAVRDVLNRTLVERTTLSVRSDKINPDPTSSPKPAARYDSLLGAPIITPMQSYGWVCLVDKLGTNGFDEEEEQLVKTLSTWLAIVYENLAINAGLQDKTEQLKQEYAAQIESANHEREAFSQFVANDIRQPLRSIGDYSRTLIEAHSANLNKDGQHLVKLIFTSATQTEKLIADMITLSHVGWKDLEKTVIDMEGLARTIVEDLQRLEPAHGPNVTIQSLPPAYGDYSMIRQALTNLIANAYKFTRGRPHPTIEIGCRHTDKETIYYIKDNGVGFDMQQAGKLFTLFHRLHRAEDFEGNGVGLAIARRVVERHGGRAWAEGQLNAGTTFYFTLSPM